ncbi:tropomyosin-like [Miscanthus floridulus]|uniref:tropomyosin-like n=1 Tax=Miscanthus floridulus TaxID=154761 RepID=UPI00345A11B0
MEPLAEENKKLKEAMNLSEKNIQRAQRERDLAESNARDLEYQKGVLSVQLATVKEQLQSKSEQLITVSTQLKDASKQLEKLQKVSEEKREQDAELGQLCQSLEQLREEKAKETKRANKRTEELDDYHRRVKAQFDVLEQDARTQRNKFDAVVARIKPVLDCVDPETAPLFDGSRQGSDTIIQRCKAAWENFKIFNRDAIMTIATHVLMVARSHYPTIDVQSIGGGFAEGLSDAKT